MNTYFDLWWRVVYFYEMGVQVIVAIVTQRRASADGITACFHFTEAKSAQCCSNGKTRNVISSATVSAGEVNEVFVV
jgi:hypothetical protein